MSLLKEFRAFAVKGNVVDLAVAVMIGGAFGKIVSALVADVIMPLVSALLPGNEWRTWEVTPIHIKLGDFLGALVDFTIIALVLFIVVVKVLGRLMPKAPVAATTKECTECCEAIPLAARRCRACTAVVVAS